MIYFLLLRYFKHAFNIQAMRGGSFNFFMFHPVLNWTDNQHLYSTCFINTVWKTQKLQKRTSSTKLVFLKLVFQPLSTSSVYVCSCMWENSASDDVCICFYTSTLQFAVCAELTGEACSVLDSTMATCCCRDRFICSSFRWAVRMKRASRNLLNP